jgi:hypothetical protein
VAALASALAKAQAELTNPEKSLLATLPPERGQPERTFHYAAGLEIVRKTLGRHEIATIQSTAVDRDSGTIQLTTTLAHASGEWIASDWPVCALADLPTPHRMGAALTYARRYALFTLVGIAGEDDLDAPDLPLQSGPATQVQSPPVSSSIRRHNGKSPKPVIMLDPEASGGRRDELIGELASISTFDEAAKWAKRILPIKNTLTADHAREVETALQVKLAWFEDAGVTAVAVAKLLPNGDSSPGKDERLSLATVDRSTLTYGHQPRRRNKEHLKFVASQPCLVCGRRPSDPHHLRFAQPQALGRKVSDEFTVPVCRAHHRELHRTRKEVGWWTQHGIDPLDVAYKLWNKTHSIPGSAIPAADTAASGPPNLAANVTGGSKTKPVQRSGAHDLT